MFHILRYNKYKVLKVYMHVHRSLWLSFIHLQCRAWCGVLGASLMHFVTRPTCHRTRAAGRISCEFCVIVPIAEAALIVFFHTTWSVPHDRIAVARCNVLFRQEVSVKVAAHDETLLSCFGFGSFDHLVTCCSTLLDEANAKHRQREQAHELSGFGQTRRLLASAS